MNQLQLEWNEDGQVRQHVMTDSDLVNSGQQPGGAMGTIRLGRDPSRCDLVLSDPTVSGRHVEIGFDPVQQHFWLQNLRDSNPPLVNGQWLVQGPIALHQGTRFYLGQVELRVTSVTIAVAPTVLVPPPATLTPPGQSPPNQPAPAQAVAPNLSYGLLCPKCQQVSTYTQLSLGCEWCGTSLAAANSVLIPNV